VKEFHALKDVELGERAYYELNRFGNSQRKCSPYRHREGSDQGRTGEKLGVEWKSTEHLWIATREGGQPELNVGKNCLTVAIRRGGIKNRRSLVKAKKSVVEARKKLDNAVKLTKAGVFLGKNLIKRLEKIVRKGQD